MENTSSIRGSFGIASPNRIVQKEETPLDVLRTKPFAELVPTDIQAAINYLAPQSSQALEEAEDVLGYAEAGTRIYPEDGDWWEVHERAYKIYTHRKALRSETAQ